MASAGDPSAASVRFMPPAPGDTDLRGEADFHQVANGQPQPGQLPTPPATPLSVMPAGFDGLSQLDQRLADGGHQPISATPDQALCVGNGYVLEGVNSAWRVFATDGTPLTGAVSTGPFFGDGHQLISGGPLVLGPLHSDPRCTFDPQTGRFFATAMLFHRDSSTTAYVGSASIELAVSRTGDPRGTWDVYTLDTTADGSTGSPALSRCPCIGDFDILGIDANGVYVTTTEWPLAAFNGQPVDKAGSRIYAISKRQLAAGTATTAVTLTLANTGQRPFPVNIEPAAVPPGGSYPSQDGGTEYFISDCFGAAGHVFLFALTNTSSLDSPSPDLSLSVQFTQTEATSEPILPTQPDGTRPLAAWIQQQTGGAQPPVELINLIAECAQVYYADGRLWTTRETSLKPPNGPQRAGVAWFQIIPTVDQTGQVSGNVANQGYVTIDQNNAIYGSIAVDRTGHGVLAFGVVGPDYYPSAAYAPIDESGTGPATIVGQGTVPVDQFVGYSYFGFGDRTTRYGDYSAAVTTGDGDYWIAQEYEPNTPRALLANWGTRITHIH
jgi:hypothetical protein